MSVLSRSSTGFQFSQEMQERLLTFSTISIKEMYS